MLVRDKIPDLKNLGDTYLIKENVSTSELMLAKKNFLKNKSDSIINSVMQKNEKELLSDTADVIELLLLNLKNLNIDEADLVKLINQKKDLLGSYEKGFLQEKES